LRGLLAVALLALVAMLGVAIAIERMARDLPSVAQLEHGYAPPQVTRVRARDGTLLANVFRERRTVVPFDSIPGHVKLAFLAAEDAGFYEHEGLDYLGMLRALAANLRAGATRQGGSTITQQVVKNVLLDSERTYRRKVRETILARRLEQHLSKDQILGLYLNHIYLGHGRYGVEEAARYYFGKRAKDMDLGEAAILAGIVAAPERFSPRNHPERALERRQYVLGQMVAKGFLDEAARRRVVDLPLRLAPAVEAESELSPEAVAHAMDTLAEAVGDRAKVGGYEVVTTIDPRLQSAARGAIRSVLDDYDRRHGAVPPFELGPRRDWGAPFEGHPKVHHIYVGEVAATDDRLGTIDVRVGDVVGRVFLGREPRYNPKGLVASEFARRGALLRVALLAAPAPGEKPPLRLELGPQGALVALDVRSREVVALVGSYEALAGGLDRATRAKRQPGSTFKPILYGYALHSRRLTPASILELPARKGRDARKIDVRTGLARSDKDAAEQVLRLVGADNVVAWAHAMGIASELGADESLALGAYEVRPLELANTYVTFANGGVAGPATVVSEIRGPGGKPVPLPARPEGRRVMGEDEAYLATSLMRSVIDFGTGRRAARLGRPLAGKTGTTNDARDTWFVGFSPDVVAAVWVGWDDSRPLGREESGARTALPAWIDFMKAAHAGRPITDFVRPGSIVVAKIDPETGLLARDDTKDARDEEFLDGTAPTELTPEPEPDGGVAAAGAADAGATGADGVDPSGRHWEPPPF
jgi:penicillin-binding protein 1A